MSLTGTTAGRSLVIVVNWYEGGGAMTISSITISGESNATLVAGSKYTQSGGMTAAGQIAYLANITASGDKTVTVNMSGSTYISCGVMEFAGMDTSSQPDASTSFEGFDADGSDSCNQNIITTTDNALIVALCTNSGATDPTVSGYTDWASYPNINFYEVVAYNLDVGVAGSKTVQFLSPFNNSGLSIVAFKVASAAVAPSVRRKPIPY
jgi:hypothetical protein